MTKNQERKVISKKIRFEVLKRDNFTCQYCGKQAPEVVLEIDHITPVVKGGGNDLFNLITSCFECNRGKGKRKLKDKTTIQKQKTELNNLNAKREQLEMLKKWRDEVVNVDNDVIKFFEETIKKACDNSYGLSEHGIKSLKSYIKRFEHKELLEVINISFEQYFKDYTNDDEKSECFNKAFNMIPRIIQCRKKQLDTPQQKELYYCRKILENKGIMYNKFRTTNMLRDLFELYDFETIKLACQECLKWSDFSNFYDEMLELE